MAKPNQGKRESRYMKQQIEKHGQNWIAIKSAKDMYKDMPRIIAEIANYNIDIDTYGYVWLSEQFKQACTQYCSDQMNQLFIINKYFQAYANQFQLDLYDVGFIEQVSKKYEAYEYIYNIIQSVIYNCSYAPMKIMQTTLNKSYRNFVQRATNII